MRHKGCRGLQTRAADRNFRPSRRNTGITKYSKYITASVRDTSMAGCGSDIEGTLRRSPRASLYLRTQFNHAEPMQLAECDFTCRSSDPPDLPTPNLPNIYLHFALRLPTNWVHILPRANTHLKLEPQCLVLEESRTAQRKRSRNHKHQPQPVQGQWSSRHWSRL